jgi:ATP phosphoribosyltransferase regulatory subunit
MTSGNSPDQTMIKSVLNLFQDCGHVPVEPPLLQPADIFLDLTGEDIRRRLFLTNGTDGKDLCLRPDFTIPVCRLHLENGAANRRADYCYHGPVFRQRVDDSGEIPQLGAESLGREDIAQADADMLGLAVSALDDFNIGERDIIIGDETLFAAVLNELGLPAVWRRRLRDLFGETDKLLAAVSRMAGETSADDDRRNVRLGFLSALDGSDPAAAHAIVEDLLSIAGLSAVGGRSPSEIADRFLEQATLASGSESYAREAEIIRSYLAIRGDGATCLEELENFTTTYDLDLGAALNGFRTRFDAIAAKGLTFANLRFAADFGRRLDYYSGFVFEIHSKSPAAGSQLVGGGRYDRLVKLLGAETEVPAIGFSIWLDRVARISGRNA